MGHATAQQRILGGFSANLRQQTLLALWAELSKNLETSSATGEIILKLSFSFHSTPPPPTLLSLLPPATHLLVVRVRFLVCSIVVATAAGISYL